MRRRLVFLMVVCLAGCGQELGRIPFHGEDSTATSVNVQEGTKLSLWTSLDIDFEGELVARYEVELHESGQLVDRTTCDPLDVSVKTGAKDLMVGNRRSIAWTGKMRCELVAKSKGLARIQAKLVFTKHPTTLTARDMTLVIKR